MPKHDPVPCWKYGLHTGFLTVSYVKITKPKPKLSETM